MKKIVTVLALLSLVMTSRAGITGSYDYATKTLTVNYVYVADPYDANNDGINPSDLNYLNLNNNHNNKLCTYTIHRRGKSSYFCLKNAIF